MHFDNIEEARVKNFMSENIVNPLKKMTHSQEFLHNVKKLRNALPSSGVQSFHTKMK
jgi:hypothetical protein